MLGMRANKLIGNEIRKLGRMASSEMLRRMALVRTDVAEELRASFIRVTKIGEIGTTLTLTSNRYFFAACVCC
jgi:DNA-binding TFAR19-related protein (PDSD5 family)